MPGAMMGPPQTNGAAGAAVMGEAAPQGPHIELEGGRKIALTESEALRLELLDTQAKLFDAQIQILTRGKHEASAKGQAIVNGAIERDRQEQQSAGAHDLNPPATDAGSATPPDPAGGPPPASGPN